MAKRATVYLVGAGPGDPGLLTVRGLELLRRADVVVYDRLVDERVLSGASERAERVYAGKAAGGHTMPQAEINALLVQLANENSGVIVRLKGGDPFVFGRGGEEAEALAAAGVTFEVVPGVTSAVAAPACAGMPVTHRGLASSFTVVTGHEDPAKPESALDWPALARTPGTLVLLMAAENLARIAGELLRHGKPAATPVAVVRWGATTRQRTLTGTLGRIEEITGNAGFGPPSVAVVGEVARLRETLSWFERRPLFGKRVLVLRTRQQAGALARLLAERGADVIELPVIETVPAEPGVLDAVARRLREYDWVLFTSANGVEAVFKRLDALGLDARAFGAAGVGAIGPGTAEALRARGIAADFLPAEFIAESAAAGLAERGVAGARVLWLRAQEARPVLAERLRSAGALVDEVVAYRTVVPEDARRRVAEMVSGPLPDVVCFTSSSTVRHLASLLGGGLSPLAGALFACIGPVTARALEGAGARADVVAAEHTMAGLVQALAERYEQGG